MTGEEVTGLPAISNTPHPLYEYFDSGFHLQCFEKWDKKEEVLNLLRDEKREYKNTEHFKEMAAKHGIPKRLEEDD
jgi:hypothetical protein